MFKNYLKTAIRNILREHYYALIKITGLALGFGTSLLLFLYVSHQLSYDKFHKDVDRLFRITQTNIWDPAGGEDAIFGSTGPAVASALVSDYPEIEQVLRINTPGSYIVRYEQKDGEVIAFNEANVLAADSNFFNFFNFSLQEGNPQTALIGRDKVVLSDKAAKRLFGEESALGKIIQLGDERVAVEVTGVTKQQPLNSHFHFDYLLSMHTNPNVKNFEWSWVWTQVVTYIKIKPHVNLEKLRKKIKSLPDRYAPSTFKKIGWDYDEFIEGQGKWELYMQPVRDIYLHSTKIGNRIGPVVDITYVYIFTVLAIFILLIAIANFINLSTARGIKRAKEVGVKKTLGLMRSSLIVQFQIEHILVTAVAMLLGLAVMELLRLTIQPLTGIEVPLNVWSYPFFALVILLSPLVVGFLAGLYPAFYLTSFRPAQVLKGRLVSGLHTSGLRNALVVFQFTISIALMSATIIVFKQIQFFRSQNLGFNKDQLLIINNAQHLGNHLELFRNEVARFPHVKSAALSTDIRLTMEDIFTREGDDTKLPIAPFKIDEHFFKTAELSLVSGRTYDENITGDKDAVIINETTARFFNWSPKEALGKRIIYAGDEVGPQEVIGVVKDFHFQSLRHNIAPLIFFNINSTMLGDNRIVTVKVGGENTTELIQRIEKKWNEIAQATPFEFTFFDEELKRQYKNEQQLGGIFSIFTILSITIAVIGLIGLAAYAAEQRKKEIGIRKVFGASLLGIYVMINTQYIRLVCVSLLIATPITWWIMQQWLNTFSYKIDMNIWYFIGAGAIELLLAVACVGYLALRAASLNPAVVLKEE